MKLSKAQFFFATILYADIFDWPLTRDEWVLWSIYVPVKTFQVPPHVSLVHEGERAVYCLLARKQLVARRQKKELNAQIKWSIARRVAVYMKLIPTLKSIGVTGGLSRDNVNQNDDIDIFCITKKGTIWISRLLAIVLTELLGVRRRPGEVDVANKICLNMFMSEDAVSITVKERDLFSAYEVLQMTLLWEREGTYKKFLEANHWVKKFLPNAWENKYHASRAMHHGKTNNSLTSLIQNFLTLILILFEPLARIIQLWYMRNRRTSEVITPGVLRFHPHDAREWIKKAFARRLSYYNLPLDKIFYGS